MRVVRAKAMPNRPADAMPQEWRGAAPAAPANPPPAPPPQPTTAPSAQQNERAGGDTCALGGANSAYSPFSLFQLRQTQKACNYFIKLMLIKTYII